MCDDRATNFEIGLYNHTIKESKKRKILRKSLTNRLISLTEIDIRESKTPKFSPAALKNNLVTTILC